MAARRHQAGVQYDERTATSRDPVPAERYRRRRRRLRDRTRRRRLGRASSALAVALSNNVSELPEDHYRYGHREQRLPVELALLLLVLGPGCLLLRLFLLLLGQPLLPLLPPLLGQPLLLMFLQLVLQELKRRPILARRRFLGRHLGHIRLLITLLPDRYRASHLHGRPAILSVSDI